MSFLLPKLTSKKEVDQAIKSTAEKVLVLRFGRDEDPVCLQLDDILSKTSSDLSKMAAIYLVDVDQTPVYTHYFDISYIPSTVFFFNGQHMKVDYGLSHFPSVTRGQGLRDPAVPGTWTLVPSCTPLVLPILFLKTGSLETYMLIFQAFKKASQK
ncbi:thioredoxin-like protein 4B isoform X1 [Acinonyx jubatus]|uniref:Thioredoxin-like protein 4B isoform X1 n=1 Tax=Acinonyx jubatus TaxID=32536 RepID=A0ABM3P670_ACIJB|nr:thioredoxin-like protein 4B isoform X1 [Acinonyx jubatus]XP_053067172.1 thioredoxin-like protein 4B isoform X1 [Acinonyx jubatus]XP_053067173.1 thioredoxin-like protein 4B isoform X1 [Acinonyx jubatus]XP_053067174.1 thioredoxin-like protein 4B isoform X1 [Acinonyx jubatus]XP_053067175.1 thioredoxin-like protein 4B isoform X1 [Acinonyx jubatus]